MSAIRIGLENATELRLDYKDLAAGQLVIVIHGLPTSESGTFYSGASGLRTTSTPASRSRSDRRSQSSPLVEEAEAINEATAYAPLLRTSLVLAAWRGQEARVLELIAAIIEDATPGNERRATVLAEYAKAVLYNGLGRYHRGVEAAERACEQEDLELVGRALSELVEAGARTGRLDVAAAALRRIESRVRGGSTDWALGIAAQSQALLAEGADADVRYCEAIERFRNSGARLHQARAQLLYGEWLRREGRRVDARNQLRPALEMLSRIGADGFAERARRELAATAETVRKRTFETRDELTAQETQVARLAAEGRTNPEIGAQLFISPRTVQYHLRKVFAKLGISSRRELGRVLPPSSQPPLLGVAGSAAGAGQYGYHKSVKPAAH